MIEVVWATRYKPRIIISLFPTSSSIIFFCFFFFLFIDGLNKPLLFGCNFLSKVGAIINFATKRISFPLFIRNGEPIGDKRKDGNVQRTKPTSAVRFIEEEVEEEYFYEDTNTEESLYTVKEEKSKQTLEKMIDEFGSTIAKSQTDIGSPQVPPMTIELQEGTPSKMEECKEQIEALLASKIIRNSKSQWASPIVFVKKKEGTLRMCIDYRKLNKNTKKNRYPIPHQEDLFDRLGGENKYFSTLDLTSAYHHIEIREEDKEKTAFITPFGLYEFNRMPFGLTNAPSHFSYVMANFVINGLDKFCINYLDDIIIFTKTIDEHIEAVKQILERIKEKDFRIKLTKCEFLKDSVQFLGHVVGKNGIGTDPGKILKIKEAQLPVYANTLLSFVAFCGYYR